MATYMVLVPVQ